MAQVSSFTVVLSILLSLCSTDTYDATTEESVLKSLYHAYGAYCDDSSLADWTCKWCEYHPNFKINSPGGVLVNSGLQVYMGYDPVTPQIVMSFRGSDNLEDWIDNLEFATMTYGNDSGQIHYGFYTAWQDLEAGGLAAMISSMFSGYPGSDILVTGHSLGGALAQIAALELRENANYNELSIGDVNVISFGSPRWCDESISTLFGEVVDSHWRIVNQRDIVPTIPLMSMGYHHTATEIRYLNSTSREYVQCDGSGEDYDDWDCYYYVPTSVDDHLNYFNLYESCSDDGEEIVVPQDEEDFVFITTIVETTDVGDVIVYKFKEGLRNLPEVAKWSIFIALAVGWILALVFCCQYYRVRSKLKKMQTGTAGNTSYFAFEDDGL